LAISRDPGLKDAYGKVEDDFFIIAKSGIVNHSGIVFVAVVFLDFGEKPLINGNSMLDKMNTSWSGR